ncbi:uncharacterized protein LOC106175307 isoform X2 [Lingula anatina]|nr:uncharacterized protein LOC106175307 isoform X2 [Lingula anatina]|eukprot:XP_013412705.1 uncharacterized protein LOC106175307 isoform X2 [Lingula anatina]
MMASQGSKISTFVFLDLETTGLLNAREKTRVTECSLVAVHRTQLLEAFRNRLSSPARVLNKLTLCFYPMKPIPHNIWQLTGLDNDNLYHQMNFTGATTEMFNAFLARLDPPVCLFAHNGDAFDFPLLKTEIENSGHSLAQGILCVDTLKMLKTIYGRGGYGREITLTPNLSVHEARCGVSKEQDLRRIPDKVEDDRVSRAQEKSIQELSEKTPERNFLSSLKRRSSLQETPTQKMAKLLNSASGSSVKRELFPSKSATDIPVVVKDELDWGSDVEDETLVMALDRYEEVPELYLDSTGNQEDENKNLQSSESILTGEPVSAMVEPGETDRVGSQTLKENKNSATGPSTNEVDVLHNQVQKNGVDISTPPKSFGLRAVFEHVFGHPPVNTHRAEGDCMSLLMICQKMAPLVCALADENAVPFSRFSAVYSYTCKYILKPGEFPYELDKF